ncbi:alkaline phosphatase family protein [Pedobacter gandavensis]|uniref:DUF4983 domain-containing protein n=1 Tax=Pedobacter gandavensis TaxID=2679963 RepID=A0ABR6EXM0_9SPHI|nr:LamG-like jellyroll fold domain-containing protein [Pedobacter gandavensis]MBB2150030.1 DUF4983 domain-containing protein [Pedobacter gandavensis]
MNNHIIKTLFLGLAVSTVSLFSACKKYDNPPPVFEEYGTLPSTNARKVLIIGIDGLAGAELKKINPATIGSLIANGKYNYEVIADVNAGTIPTWVSLMTGTSSNKHRVFTDSFRPSPNEDEHVTSVIYPNFLYRILETKPDLTTVTVTSNPTLNRYFNEAARPVLAGNDASVKDSVLKVLQNANPSVVLANFQDVETTGKKDGYTADVPTFSAAVTKVDGYIAEVLDALKKRKEYNKEEWLVIVTTNRGGSETSPKAGFIVCSNPNLKSEALVKKGFNTIAFNNSKIAAVIEKDNGLYDGGTNKDFTTQVQVKFNNNATWPGFFSKSTDVGGHATTGWTMIYNGGNWEVVIGGKNNGGGSSLLGGTTVNDRKWHTLTLTVKTVGAVRTAKVYTDGVLNRTTDISGSLNLTTTEPLKIGYRNQDNGGTNLDFNIGDVQYFNVALDDATVKNNIALQDITKHPNYANLTGFWPVDEGAGALLVNKAPVGYSFKMTGPYRWVGLGTDIPVSRVPQSMDGISVVTAGPDVTALLYYWLKIPIKPVWDVDGSGWLSKFEVEFLK